MALADWSSQLRPSFGEQRAQYRPCTLDARPLEDVSSWTGQYRPIWEARFDRMDDYLGHLQGNRKDETGK